MNERDTRQMAERCDAIVDECDVIAQIGGRHVFQSGLAESGHPFAMR